jgi:hypothetical protein
LWRCVAQTPVRTETSRSSCKEEAFECKEGDSERKGRRGKRRQKLTLVKLFKMKNRCGKYRASVLELVDVEACSLPVLAEPEACNFDASLSLSVSLSDLE